MFIVKNYYFKIFRMSTNIYTMRYLPIRKFLYDARSRDSGILQFLLDNLSRDASIRYFLFSVISRDSSIRNFVFGTLSRISLIRKFVIHVLSCESICIYSIIPLQVFFYEPLHRLTRYSKQPDNVI